MNPCSVTVLRKRVSLSLAGHACEVSSAVLLCHVEKDYEYGCQARRSDFFCCPASSFSLSAAGLPPLGRMGIEQGLSNNSVKAIYRGHRGFLWFGTFNGLNRYDGCEFKIFRNRLNDSTSHPYNYIYAITEDLQNNL